LSTIRLALLAVPVAASVVTPVSAQVADPHATIDHFDRARGARNVDAALAQFADDAIVHLPAAQAVGGLAGLGAILLALSSVLGRRRAAPSSLSGRLVRELARSRRQAM
jgi:hypothetical protein